MQVSDRIAEGSPVDDELRAYREAYRLLEGVQGDDPEVALDAARRALQRADDQGWTHAELVLRLVLCAHGLATDPNGTTWDAAELLLCRARSVGAPAMEAAALGVRAVLAGTIGDTAALLSDAATAVTLLDDDTLPAADRATGYVVVAAAYNGLRLWEIVDDLYDRAQACDREDLCAAQRAALAVNRVIVRIEWALALAEVGADAEAVLQLVRALHAVDLARETPMPRLWRRVAVAGGELVELLTDPSPRHRRHQVEVIAEELRAAGDAHLLPLLEASWALALHRAGHRREAERAARRMRLDTSSSSGGSTVPSWVRAVILRGRRPGARVRAQADHIERLALARWQARLAMLDAASAQVDVARRRTERDRLLLDATTDALTGLSNRRVFDAWLADTGQPSASVALLLIDLDDFKEVNDRYGHAVGDDVLRLFGRLITGVLRAGDVGLRLGGDEFAVLVAHGSDGDGVTARIDALHALIREQDWEALTPGRVVGISTGVGLGPATPGATSVSRTDLYRAADEDLYAAKRGQTVPQ